MTTRLCRSIDLTGTTAVPAIAYAVVLAIAALQLTIDPLVGARAAAPYALGSITFFVVRLALGSSPTTDAGDRSTWHRSIEAIAVSGSALALWLTWRFLSALPSGFAGDAPDGYYRVKVAVTSPVGDHNTAAGLLLVAAVAAAMIAQSRSRGWIWLGLITVGIVTTLSRGAVVIFAVVAVASWWTVRRRAAMAVTLSALVAAAGVAGAALALGTAPPPGTAVPDGPLGASVIGRLDLARRGVELMADHPLLGVGFGRFAANATDLPPPNDHAHQLLAHAGAEGGVLAALAVALLATTLLVCAWRRRTSAIGQVALLGGGALIAHAQFEILGGRVGYELLIASLLGLLLSDAEHAPPVGPS